MFLEKLGQYGKRGRAEHQIVAGTVSSESSSLLAVSSRNDIRLPPEASEKIRQTRLSHQTELPPPTHPRLIERRSDDGSSTPSGFIELFS